MVSQVSILGWAFLLYSPFLTLGWLFARHAPQLFVIALLSACVHCTLWLLFGSFFRLLCWLLLGSSSAAAVTASDGDSGASIVAAVLAVVVHGALQAALRVACVVALLWVQTQLRRMRQVLLYSRFRWVGVSLALGVGEALVAVTTSGGPAVEQAYYSTYYAEVNATTAVYNLQACPQLPVFVHSAAQSLLYTVLLLSAAVLGGQSLAAFFNVHAGYEEGEGEAQPDGPPPVHFGCRCRLMWRSITAFSAASRWHHADPLEPDLQPMMQPVEPAAVDEAAALKDGDGAEDGAAAYGREGPTHAALRDALPPCVAAPVAAAVEEAPAADGGGDAAAPALWWVPSESVLLFYLPFARLSLLLSVIAPLVFRVLPALLHHGAGTAQPDGSTAVRPLLGCAATLPLQMVLTTFLLLWCLWIVRVEYTTLKD
ncbi:hypothetical protein STCU_08167 [Strigomonas culicis]|uniref:Uncharacterized protein n=1 Tax=Strigomonas culicis TaxID=28005 RepID=S9TW56_9TRYP|nr:hypothetical protein STCU_08167 [Strigomonas culicis]|eukprot:EPY22702.1 hypothetical protein STCU_08167 [Strigomonas culicis]